ncbi:Cyclic nucleotide-gated ion channel 4 [Dionaea muscipula]
MASERDTTLVRRLQTTTRNQGDPHQEEDEEEEEEEEEEVDEVDVNEEEEEDGVSGETTKASRAHDGCCCFSGFLSGSLTTMGRVLDPRASWVQDWNRVFLLVCTLGLFVDPLFFYVLSISETYLCLFVDGWFAITLTVLRCMMDALHVWNMWLQLKTTRHPYGGGGGAEGKGTGHVPVLRYLKAMSKFDLFVILPLPQVVTWIVIPHLLRRGSTMSVMTVFLILFLFQYLPKIYHAFRLMRRMQNLSGYVFGTRWWGFALNVIAYFVASHAAGACWYLLGIQRTMKCLREQCIKLDGSCNLTFLASKEEPIYYGTTSLMIKADKARQIWAADRKMRLMCLDSYDNYPFGAYQWVIYLVCNDNRFEKILLPIFWGLMTMSTFGNLESTTDWIESVFIIIVITSGLLLVTMLIGNMKVFVHATTSKKHGMQSKMNKIELWMRRRKLPPQLKQRVRSYEWQRWAAMRGVDECEMISNLPEGLRRDIKYHLCLDLVRQVPLFQHMDELVLENICDRVKSLIFTKGETITREGDPVGRMIFVVRGHLQSSQVVREGVKSCCMLGPGNFSGDELLSWCLRRPFIERLPPSSSTLITLETTEAFGLEAEDVKYVTQHFRYTFVNEKVKRSARYYSPAWRTWAAVAIQLAWRKYKAKHQYRITLPLISFSSLQARKPLIMSSCSNSNSTGEELDTSSIRLYTALLTSPKPEQDDFDF